MFCPNCGAQLPDGSQFCAECGTRLAVAQERPSGIPVTPVKQPKKQQPNNFSAGEARPKKKRHFLKFVAVIAALAIIAGVGFIVKSLLFSGSKGDQAYVYLSEGKYELITNIKKNESAELASSRSEYPQENFVTFSPDGKYLYYLTRFDDEAYAGTLCRAEYEKIQRKPEKKDKYIETIASNVRPGFRLFDNGMIVYKNSKDALYCYDGKNTEQVARSVNSLYQDKQSENRFMYTTRYDESGYVDLYGVDLKNIQNPIKLASNCSVISCVDSSQILYTKGDYDNLALYVTNFDAKENKLGNRVDVIALTDSAIYYTEVNDGALNLYDYVIDEKAAEEEKIKEPRKEDYVRKYVYYNLDRGHDASDFDKLYTSCTQTTHLYNEKSYYKSFQYAAENEEDDEKRAAYKAFVDKHLSMEDEDGYFLVTGEVKDDLIALASVCGEGAENEWLQCCFYQDVEYNIGAYDEAMNAYRDIGARNNIRSILKSSGNAVPLKNLYCYSKGTKTLICDNVVETASYEGAFIYNTADMITEQMPLEDIHNAEDMLPLFDINHDQANSVIFGGQTTPLKVSGTALSLWSDVCYDSYAYLHGCEKNLFLKTSEEELYEAVISGDTITEFSLISEDATVLNYDQGTLYFANELYEDDYSYYYDIYTYKDKKKTCIAKDVLLDRASLYTDGTFLGMTAYIDDLGYEMTMFEADGTRTLIADSVSQYIRVDEKNLLYISDGELYLYNGKEKTQLASDVDLIWAKEQADKVNAFTYYNYMGY